MKKRQSALRAEDTKLDADVPEAFRRARSSIGAITTDLQQLRRRAAAMVKTGQRTAKSK